MLAAVDYIGLGTLVSAIGATIVSIIVALRQSSVKGQVNDVHAAVTTSNGNTLGMLADKVSAQLDAQDAATEGKP
jgi:hypothetical protein